MAAVQSAQPAFAIFQRRIHSLRRDVRRSGERRATAPQSCRSPPCMIETSYLLVRMRNESEFSTRCEESTLVQLPAAACAKLGRRG
jgi:hypothetical protein